MNSQPVQSATSGQDPDQELADHQGGGLVQARIDTPIGTLGLVTDEVGLCAILFDGDGPMSDPSTHNPADARIDVLMVPTVSVDDHPVLAQAATQLGEYFDGKRTRFDLRLHPVGTEFQRAAWQALTTIPYGTTLSYGAQAELMGDRKKARAVGAANGKNPLPIVVPCHRVIGANGSLTGFAGGVKVKEWLLDFESAQTRLPLAAFE